VDLIRLAGRALRLILAAGLVAAFGPAIAQPTSSAPLPAPPSADLAELSDFGEVTLDGIVFVKIPAGRFVMGATNAQRSALKAAGAWTELQEDERPSRVVTITRPFLIGKYEVTQQQWTPVISKNPPGANNRERAAIRDPAAFKGATLPVESVSWQDVQAFLERLNPPGVKSYRLPTEAEWEYCARAGGSSMFGLGAANQVISETSLAEFAWFRVNAGSRTQPVGGRQPNAWGLHDLLGNVWEWCQDWYAAKFYSGAPAVDPLNTTNATERVFRGGCWFLEPHQLRASLRGGNLPGFRSPYVGFRLVREL
jgi:formylglycine-generating enzyme required for sulfatase activity